MSTLNELIYYCSEENPLGAALLTGEWGCGKTYLIENQLAEALRATHLIVRVSLFGVNSIEALNNAVHRQWLFTCTPFLGKLKNEREKLHKDAGFFQAVAAALRSVNPVAGNVASAMVAVDPIDMIPVSPVIDDLRTREQKHVVLVFDDLERSRLDSVEMLGCINDYCENMKFNTLIIANEEAIWSKAQEDDSAVFRILKEKVIAHTVLYEPEFPGIVHAVIADRSWQSEPYAAFLLENEALILEAFASDPSTDETRLTKAHNIRSLICALKQFFRVYVHLDHNHVPHMEKYLYSFIVYMLFIKNGYTKDGKTCHDFNEEDIAVLYPKFSSDYLPPSVRRWIEFGCWNRADFEAEVLGRPAEASSSDDGCSAEMKDTCKA